MTMWLLPKIVAKIRISGSIGFVLEKGIAGLV